MLCLRHSTYILKIDEGISNTTTSNKKIEQVALNLLAVIGEVNTKVHEIIQASACLVNDGF
jgi:hypothetical protein